jgi:hypothetical protein
VVVAEEEVEGEVAVAVEEVLRLPPPSQRLPPHLAAEAVFAGAVQSILQTPASKPLMNVNAISRPLIKPSLTLSSLLLPSSPSAASMERSVDDMFRSPDAYKQNPEYRRVMEQLRQNLSDKFSLHARRLKRDLQLAEDNYAADKYLAEKEYVIVVFRST